MGERLFDLLREGCRQAAVVAPAILGGDIERIACLEAVTGDQARRAPVHFCDLVGAPLRLGLCGFGVKESAQRQDQGSRGPAGFIKAHFDLSACSGASIGGGRCLVQPLAPSHGPKKKGPPFPKGPCFPTVQDQYLRRTPNRNMRPITSYRTWLLSW